MSNRVDFYLSREQRLAVPAGRCIVFVGGAPCPYLSVKEIVRAGAPEYGRACLVYDPAVWPQGERVTVERIETVAALGRRVCVASVYDGGMGAAAVETVTLFAGSVEHIETDVGGDREAAEIVARDFAARMGRITVFGSRVLDRDGRTVRLAGREPVFNRDGLPNGSAAAVQHAGQWRRVFESDPARARRWTCAEAVRCLLCEHLAAGELGIPCIEQLEGVFGGHILRALDVTGMSLLRAVEECCERTGVKFRFEPAESQAGHDERVVFYRPGAGRSVELNHQCGGERLSLTRTNMCRVASRRGAPVTHRFVGWGGWKTYEATFGLIKAWDPSLEGGQQDVYSPSTNEDFAAVRDVYRRWCLNEAGDYSDPPYNQGGPFDFSRIFEQAGYIRHRRRFEKALSTRDGESRGWYLEVSYDSGATWRAYADSFDVLKDECGVRLSSDELSAELWPAIAAGTLKFRITATVQSDTRLIVIAANGPVNSTAEVTDHLIEANEFQYRKVSPASVFYRGTGTLPVCADERDNSEALHGYVRHICEGYDAVIETIDVETPIVAQFHLPGDRVVCGLDSRDVLGVRRDARSVFVIDRAAVDFEKQCTRLRILQSRRRP
jgi:hypothetical protein